jgi:hypothetical protein
MFVGCLRWYRSEFEHLISGTLRRKDLLQRRDINDFCKTCVRQLIYRKCSKGKIHVSWERSLFGNLNAETWPVHCNSYDTKYKKYVLIYLFKC